MASPRPARRLCWTEQHATWERSNPPPLEPIGDESVQAWRAREKAKAEKAKVTAAAAAGAAA